MRGTIHHIDLTVSDLMVSAAFYETVLGFLGYRLGRIGSTIGTVLGCIIWPGMRQTAPT
jgi:predicted enzyme related to lactoylglutathione lyase